MKKLIATLLTGCLVLQSCIGFTIPIHGAAASTQFQNTAVKTSDSPSEAVAQSTLQVEVHSSPRFPYTDKVQVEISTDNKVVANDELDFSDSTTTEPTFKTAQFSVKVNSNYTVTVLAKKFAKYEQQDIKIEKENTIHKITIYPTEVKTGNENTPGQIFFGDVNDDYEITQDGDVKQLLSDIRSDSENSASDLDNNGKVDIADLQMLVQNLGKEPQDSYVEELTPFQKVDFHGTITNGGSITDLLNSKSVSIELPKNEEITEENAPEIAFTLEDKNTIPEIEGMVLQAPMVDNNGNTTSEITNFSVTVVTVDKSGTEVSITTSYKDEEASAQSRQRKVKGARTSESVTVKKDSNGSLILDLGGQIAVKKVTIKILGTRKEDALVNIAKVEFVNDMENRIPAPELSIPKLDPIVPGNESLTISWKGQSNVTGYEIFIHGSVGKKDNQKEDEQIISVSNSTYTVSAINNASLINSNKYTIKVRSVNGDWRSPWSDPPVTGIPKPDKKPVRPEDVKATGGYRSVKVNWKNMKDSSLYMVYYKKSTDPDSSYQPVKEGFKVPADQTQPTGNELTENACTITGLEENVDYTIYVVGWNELGWGAPSANHTATTTGDNPPQLPNYKLLNTSNGEGKLTAHIVKATIGGSGKMEASPLDTEAKSGLGLVDNDYGSYWSKIGDWDDGVSYPALGKGVFVTLDNDYKMNYLTFAAADDDGVALETVRIEYKSSTKTGWTYIGARLLRRQDEHKNRFYIVKFDNTITASEIHMSLGRSYTRAEMKIGEIHFHEYDSLEDDIMGLYTDEMHSTLRTDVTSTTIEVLEARLETIDSKSGEKHPVYNELKLELKTAKEILNSNLAPAYNVDNQITAQKDKHVGFGGLNAWQPLGKVAYAGETLLVYVGHNTRRTGDSTNLQLVMTQYHSEVSSLAKTVSLKVGRNEITVPSISSMDVEKGGQLYVAYTGNNASDKYAVRVSGGSDIPVLNVYKKTGQDRTNAIKTYVKELEKYVAAIESAHNSQHKDGAKAVNYSYSQNNCILNATDIMMEKMMYSLPALQVWGPMKSTADKVAQLDAALQAMEDTMTLFYQHKGLSNDAAAAKKGNNALPSQHLNIRYMRMFAGAFMYAAGNHIGIEYGSTTLASGAKSWDSFGWGIAHEIGHDINQGTYAVAEVTNNYFSQLLTKKQRFNYDNVYKKVTSGTIGRASNVFTQLALYWQLHLAYDDNTTVNGNNMDDRRIFTDYEDLFNNVFFARVDTYSRNPGKAPKEGLTLNGGTEQNLMRLSCAAAEKNILPFFERWGMVPDQATITYAEKYGERETKALYYVNPEARAYRVKHPDEEGTIKKQDVVTASASANSNQVTLEITANVENTDVILGYEISRSMTSNGKEESKVVGFQPINTSKDSTTFIDTISTINNRVMSYTVTAVDKFLNYSNAASAGAVKIQTDGVINKDSWTVETTMTSSDDDIANTPDDKEPDNNYYEENSACTGENNINSIERIIDNDKTNAKGTYNGQSKGNAAITIDMHETKEVTALKYLGTALSSVTVEVSTNATVWTTVKSDYEGLKESITETKEQTIWFDSVDDDEEVRNSWIGTYDARYVRLTIPQSGNISIKEIEICGPSGDNLEFRTTDDKVPAIGTLTEDYHYDDKGNFIPAGSLLFTGTYKGNPAYNVVVLYDTKGNVIGAKDGKVEAQQVILAKVPEKGNLGETSDGTWIYYVEPKQWNKNTLKDISGVRGELYRVDDALTLEGERIVSDTLIIEIPETLPNITITGGGTLE